MNILYSGDANIADGVFLSSLSLAKHNSEELSIYILTASLVYNGEERRALEPSFARSLEDYLLRYNERVSVKLIDISEKFAKEVPTANINTRFTPFCMLRLYADSVDGLPDKILYLDNDVLCRGDISEFYDTDIEDSSLAGVLDNYGSHFFRQKLYKRDYLNSGVLLLNMRRIRENGLFRKAREMCVSKKMFMPDQSALNKLCTDKIICPRRYNEQRRLRKNTVLQHFTTSFRLFPYFHSVTVKPWNTEGMHKTLGLYEYDDLLSEYLNLKNDLLTKGEPNK